MKSQIHVLDEAFSSATYFLVLQSYVLDINILKNSLSSLTSFNRAYQYISISLRILAL